MLSRGMVLVVAAYSVLGATGGGPHAAAQSPADYEAYFVGHWKIEPREEDDLAVIDGELWGRVNRDREGPAVAPTDEELATYREERKKDMASSSARNAEREHHIFEPGGRLVRLRRFDSTSDRGKVRYGTYKVEREESGRFVLVLQMDGQKATRQLLYADTIHDAFRQGSHAWNTGSQYRIVDSDHYQHAVVRDKMPHVYHVQTYARVAAPPDWAAAMLAREAKAAKQVVVRLDQGALTINDTKLSFPCFSTQLFEALGKPDRERKTEFNTIFLWDRAGVCAYQKPGTRSIHGISLFFDVASLDKRHWPREAWGGELIIDNLPVDGRMSLEAVNKDRATPFQPLPNFNKWKRIQHGKVLITLESAPAASQEQGLHFGQLNLERKEED